MPIALRNISGRREWWTTGNSGRRVGFFNTYGRHSFTRPPIKATLFDDFLGDTLNTNTTAIAKGSDGAAADFAVSAAVGGMIRGTMGAGAGASMAANGVQIDGGALQWKANAGNLIFGARVKISAITAVQLFVGLTDQTGTLEAPFTLGSSDALTSNATDAVGFLFDTAADTDDIWLVGVKADTDATKQDTGLAMVADTYRDFLIELDSSGNATFWIDDVKRGSIMANAVTASVALTPVINGFARAASSRTIDVDYWFVQSDRA